MKKVRNKKRYGIAVIDKGKRYVIETKKTIKVGEEIAYLFLQKYGLGFITIESVPEEKKESKKKTVKKIKTEEK